ncbi:MAG: hypothetical protein JO301_04775 [Chitinophagaceae bacterium]|nr:hypothetical protein [Chitinophagaceae bacterium]
MLLPLGLVAEIVCMLFAFRFLAGEENYWGSFRWFMVFTVVVETIGYVLLMQGKVNHGLYNLYLPVEMFFKYYILYRLCRSYFRVTYWIIPFLVLFVALYIFEGITNHFDRYSVQSNSVAALGILIICVSYFYHFLKKDEYVNIYEHAPFWIITALFFFYLGGTACNLFFDYLADIYRKQHIPVRFIIFTILNFMLYGCWSYSFVCRYRRKISSS